MAIVRCHIIVNELGVRQYVPFAVEDMDKGVSTLIMDNVPIFNIFPKGDKIDLRSKPPFLSIIPCPYCGTENDRKHDPLQHVNPKFGTPEEEVKALAKDIANEYGIENQWGDLTVLAAEEFLDKRLGRTNPKTRTQRVKEVIAKRALSQINTKLFVPEHRAQAQTVPSA
jgi:hypothetical protein